MPRPIEKEFILSNVDVDGIVEDGDSSGTTVELNGDLVVDGVYTSADSLGKIITITDTSTTDQSGVNFTITGTDANGYAQTETLQGPGSGATVASTKYFYTVTNISISAAQGGSETVDIGTRNATSTAVSKVIPLNWRNDVPATFSVDVTGTINYKVQQTFDNALRYSDASGKLSWVDAIESKTSSTTGSLTLGARGVRVFIASYSDGAALKVRIIEPSGCRP